jgi:NADH:ubiquinone oxidoreductase subunit F (NADH-binding)/(2Fe-2S) ferredoxin
MKIRGERELRTIREKGTKLLYPSELKITIGEASCGLSRGARIVEEGIREEVKRQKPGIKVGTVGCNGFCSQEPIVEVIAPGKPKITYGRVTRERVKELVQAAIRGEVVKDLVVFRTDYGDMLDERIPYTEQVPYPLKEVTEYHTLPTIKKQQRYILRNSGVIDPENIEEYIARGGYSSLLKALTMKPKDIIKQVKEAGLRGRGGGGFPTGIKWEACFSAKGKEKYIICNGSEGEPGIGMHRSLLESDPHSIIEGIIIAAYALGAHEGYFYIRDGYPLAIKRVKKAIEEASALGLLGENICNSAFNFTLKVKRGGGVFVCGEETALIAAIEGRVGEPRQRPPFPVESGLWGKPTVINNLETMANVPLIISKGSEWYKKMGSKTSKGTKVISLTGNIKNPGLIEVPMGTPLREIIEIGGGAAGKLKAIQTGGPSGGVLPASYLDLPLGFDELKQAGSMLGSGGMVVIDEGNCMVDLTRYFTAFFEDESCGKCVPCREGVTKMREILDEIATGKGEEGDLAYLEHLAHPMQDGAACALGKTSVAPFLSTLKHFRKEYEAHIKEKKCPSGVCKEGMMK